MSLRPPHADEGTGEEETLAWRGRTLVL